VRPVLPRLAPVIEGLSFVRRNDVAYDQAVSPVEKGIVAVRRAKSHAKRVSLKVTVHDVPNARSDDFAPEMGYANCVFGRRDIENDYVIPSVGGNVLVDDATPFAIQIAHIAEIAARNMG
jgi:hypothetical protein